MSIRVEHDADGLALVGRTGGRSIGGGRLERIKMMFSPRDR
jgi:hypothetical protein